MRIATYNIWNSPTDQLERLYALCEELTRIDADIVALQEVPLDEMKSGEVANVARIIGDYTPYAHTVFRKYPDDIERLGFVSKHPFTSVEAGWDTQWDALCDCGLRVKVNVGGVEIAVTNVHLIWNDISHRERQILDATDWIAARTSPSTYEFLCGDFNCPPDSSVHRYLAGQQSLAGKHQRGWYDLAVCQSARTGVAPPITLDTIHNPRFAGNAPVYPLFVPARLDWMLLKHTGSLPSPVLTNVELFGTQPTPKANIVPSDHYGVLCDLEFAA